MLCSTLHAEPPYHSCAATYTLCVSLQASEYTRTSHLDSITIPQAPRLGSQVVEIENLSKSYGDRLLMKDVSFSVPPGSVVGQLLNTDCTFKYTLTICSTVGVCPQP